MNSCYSFKGASLSADLKTIQINNIRLEIAGGPTNLSLTVNEKLKEYFQRNTTLKLVNQNPDLLIEGTIVGYELTPQAPTTDDKAGLNRLTLKISFNVVNRLDDTKNFEQEFSFYQDFPQNQTLTQVEKTLIPKLTDQIILDLFNKIAGDW
ncbi:MAG: LptE family protein [Aquirufa sp.]